MGGEFSGYGRTEEDNADFPFGRSKLGTGLLVHGPEVDIVIDVRSEM
jgi:hypothetical protein